MFRRVATSAKASLRRLNLQEFSSKELMEKHGLAVQRFRMAETAAEGQAGAQEYVKPLIISLVSVVSVFLILVLLNWSSKPKF